MSENNQALDAARDSTLERVAEALGVDRDKKVFGANLFALPTIVARTDEQLMDAVLVAIGELRADSALLMRVIDNMQAKEVPDEKAP